MNKIVIDTHSLFWYLYKNSKLSNRAKVAIRNSYKVYIPVIVLFELLYLMRKIKIADQFPMIFTKILESGKYSIIPEDILIVNNLVRFQFELEIHDNIIVTTAKTLGLALVTKDPEIQKIYKNTIW